MCAQSLSCSKSRYLLFSRHGGFLATQGRRLTAFQKLTTNYEMIKSSSESFKRNIRDRKKDRER